MSQQQLALQLTFQSNQAERTPLVSGLQTLPPTLNQDMDNEVGHVVNEEWVPFYKLFNIGERVFPIHHHLSNNSFPTQSFLLQVPVLIFSASKLRDFLARFFNMLRAFELNNIESDALRLEVPSGVYCGCCIQINIIQSTLPPPILHTLLTGSQECHFGLSISMPADPLAVDSIGSPE